MNDNSNHEQAAELLQQLGLKEYEAKCFVALSRMPRGTAKEISEISDVPRTRVYDAIRVLETKGLVEVQHASPQQFRAVSIPEATETFRQEYESRIETLGETLRDIEPAPVDGESEVTHEVWVLASSQGIENRTAQLLDEAQDELVLVIGHESVFTEDLAAHLREAHQRGVSVFVGAISEGLRNRIEDTIPEAEVFVSGLEWLSSSIVPEDETEIGRLLLVDKTTILVSSFHDGESGGEMVEQAVFGRGFDNGLVAIVRRLMATGLSTSEDARKLETVGRSDS